MWTWSQRRSGSDYNEMCKSGYCYRLSGETSPLGISTGAALGAAGAFILQSQLLTFQSMQSRTTSSYPVRYCYDSRCAGIPSAWTEHNNLHTNNYCMVEQA
jgi:hypothetical protein